MFKKILESNRNCKMLVTGTPGTGKAVFALGGRSLLAGGQEVAYLCTHPGAVHYRADPELGGFSEFQTRDISEIEAAVRYLEREPHSFRHFIVDSLTDLWGIRQKKFLRPNRQGHPDVSKGDWMVAAAEHSVLVQRLINLNGHVVILSGEKLEYGWENQFAGYGVDAYKEDAKFFDILLRFYRRESDFFAEVVRDATGRTAGGDLLKSPCLATWAGEPVDETDTIAHEVTFLSILGDLQTAQGKHALEIFTSHQGYIDKLPDDQINDLVKARDRASGEA